MKENNKIKIGITIGDMNGVGPEIILKSFLDKRMLDFCTPIIYASSKSLDFFKNHFSYNISFYKITSPKQAAENKVNVIDCWDESPRINFGKIDNEIGKHAIASLRKATKDLSTGEINVMVTAPINKKSVQSDKFSFPGHTEYLNSEINGEAIMIMVSNKLRICTLTTHIPIKEISSGITKPALENKIRALQKTLIEDFNISKPKIAVLGVNPHAGDQGLLGSEEKEIIMPALKKMLEDGSMVFGPYSADGFFGSNQQDAFDAILAMYHDQGLIPFKTLSFGQGVNYTGGLDKIRTSPDHGTAYEIAGKGIADETSFKESIFLAISTYKNREEHLQLIEGAIKEEKTAKTK